MTLDVHAQLAGFVRALRAAGVTIGIDQHAACAEALTLAGPARRDVYLAARATLILRREDLPIFDEQFAAYFADPAAPRPTPAPLAPRHDAVPHRTALLTYMAERARPDAPERELPDVPKAASPIERLQHKPLGACTPDELAEIARALRALRFRVVERPSHRYVPSARGRRLDLARVVRDAARRHGAITRLHRRARKLKRRPLVVLADVSGSMERYARLLLQLVHALNARHAQTESFVFATRLTSITRQLAIRDLDTALDHAVREISDFAGGTRIADCLHQFARRHAGRALRRGAVLLVISDGWDTGDPAALAAAVRGLADRSHRLIWLSPLVGDTGYQPRTAGLALARRHIDDLLSVRDLHALRQLSEHLGRLPRRKQRPLAERSLV